MSAEPIYEPAWPSPRGVEIMRALWRGLYHLLGRVEVRGLEYVPPTGAFIFAANHVSYIDPPMMFISLTGRRMAVFAADKYRHSIFHSMLNIIDVIWVHRGAITPAVIKTSVRALRAGTSLGMAPEGTRSRITHALQTGKTGVAYLSWLADAPVIPVAVSGADVNKVLDSYKHFRRPHLTIAYGKPVPLPARDGSRHPSAQQLEDYTTEIMCQLAALLPPEYRGVYADHPRLKELLEQLEQAG